MADEKKFRPFMAAFSVMVAVNASNAWGQVAAPNRPAPIKIGQPAVPSANTVPGDGRVAAQIAELQTQIAALRAELKAAQNQIVGLQNGLKTTSLKGFENAGNLSALLKQYQSHSHYFPFKDTMSNGQGGLTYTLKPSETTIPNHNCVTQPITPGAKIVHVTDRYRCTAP